jgi:excisionase family DNA binding protein
MEHKKGAPPTKEFHSVGHVAEVIGKCRRTVYRAVKEKKIKSVRFGASVMIPADELQRILVKGF